MARALLRVSVSVSVSVSDIGSCTAHALAQ
jgi:hypothetical protein